MNAHRIGRPGSLRRAASRNQRGATLVEAVLLLVVFLAAVLTAVQLALFFYARSNVNLASHAAARAGSLDHANVSTITQAFQRGMFGYYGGGRNLSEQTETLKFIAAHPELVAVRVQIISPTQESFDDFYSPALQTKYGVSEKVLPNVGVDALDCPRDRTDCAKDPHTNASGQTLQDANLLKLRITYGVPPVKQLPWVGKFFASALQLLGAGSGDAYKTGLLAAGAIPVVTTATVRMQSDPIRNSAMISSPGKGDEGDPKDPGPPSPGGSLPKCDAMTPLCTVPPEDTGGGDPGGGTCGPGSGGGHSIIENVSADVLFDFDSAKLNDAGKAVLDSIISEAATRSFTSLKLDGYTDPLGSFSYNKRLSLDRANAVKDYLQSHGFPAKPITTEGKGPTDLVKTLSDCPAGPGQVKCLAPDRRVTFTFEGTS